MLIKICGITSKEDIDICINNKVDIVGFLIQSFSKLGNRLDMLELNIAKELISYVPNKMESCLLIHLKDINKILSILEELKPTMIQIQKQSELSIENLKEIKLRFPDIKIIKTFYIEDNNFDIRILISKIKDYIESKSIDFLLLDSMRGGSGKVHDWNKSAQVIDEVKPFPIILAGGLTPENVKDALFRVNPFGVDVMSGVSTASYKKDEKKVNKFVNNIRG